MSDHIMPLPPCSPSPFLSSSPCLLNQTSSLSLSVFVDLLYLYLTTSLRFPPSFLLKPPSSLLHPSSSHLLPSIHLLSPSLSLSIYLYDLFPPLLLPSLPSPPAASISPSSTLISHGGAIRLIAVVIGCSSFKRGVTLIFKLICK